MSLSLVFLIVGVLLAVFIVVCGNLWLHVKLLEAERYEREVGARSHFNVLEIEVTDEEWDELLAEELWLRRN